MNSEDKLLESIHKIFRNDSYIKSLFRAEGKNIDKLISLANDLKKEFLFSSMSEDMIKAWEKLMNYKTSNSDIDNRRKEIEARWKTSGKCDLKLLQAIADAWRAGTVILSFVDGTIQLGFTSEASGDYDLIGLTNSINEAKPAHLDMNFIYQEQLRGKQYINCFDTVEIEEIFAEKNVSKNIDIDNYLGLYQEVIEIYGI